MATLSEARILTLLEPFLAARPGTSLLVLDRGEVAAKMSAYLDLLLKWNARTNLTAIREPEAIVQRHFGESLFAGLHLAPYLKPGSAVLDFGSGAGFPGLPIQVLFPELQVTLAESQGKKAAFLQEAVRTLGVQADVWPRRVEEMPETKRFDSVTLRAVDNMSLAVAEAEKKVAPGGALGILTGEKGTEGDSWPLPASESRYFQIRKIG